MGPLRTRFCVALVTLAVGGLAESHGQAAADRQPPNVVLIMIDDLGWMDLHCQGNQAVDTPHIDRLARQGMRFTDAYAAAPVCSPTRAAVITGLSPARVRITNHLPDQARFTPPGAKLLPAAMLDHLPLEHVTIAERLKQAGYHTAFLGKWHLCGGGDVGLPEFYPQHQGFDVNIGGCALGGPPTYFDPYRIPALANRREGEYLTDRLVDEAIAFIREHRQGPFLVNLWNYTVHWPMEAKPAMVEKYAARGKRPGVKDVRYAAMIECLDDAMGRLLTALDEMQLTRNTLVIFTSDNGGYTGVADNRPLRLGKGFLYEGGLRVPLIVRWPGVVEPGGLCSTPVVSMDFYPTLLEAAGLAVDPQVPLDGESLVPLLRQTGGLKRREIYFHYPNYAFHSENRLGGAVRQGDYKLIENFDDGSVELYNLAKDIGESHDLSAAMPEKAEGLVEKLRQWRKQSGAKMPVPAKPD